MKIGILGSGEVGQRLGSGFIGLGHSVKIGTRDPNQEKIKEWVKKNGEPASAVTFSQAATFVQLIVIATSWA
jgi:predicted dinucleotide-binding enzyme